MNGPNDAVDLNADLGEGFPNDGALLDLVTSASVCCGAHAGDPDTILTTLKAAAERGVVLGAHPGFADRAGFGRGEQPTTRAQAAALVLDQFASLAALAREAGTILRFVKPHGALYNQAQRDPVVAQGIIEAVVGLGMPVLGQPGSVLESMARQAGARFVAEGFPDRRYGEDGRLVPRSQPDAVLDDPAEVESQVLRLVRAGIATLCIHGDDPRAVSNATLVRGLLTRHGLAVKSFA